MVQLINESMKSRSANIMKKRIQRVNLIWPEEVTLFGRALSPSASHLAQQIGGWFPTFAASAHTG